MNELTDVLKAFIDRCEADIGELIKMEQLIPDAFTYVTRVNILLTPEQQGFLYAGDRRVNLRSTDRTLAQSQVHATSQFSDNELGTCSVALHDGRHLKLDALVCCETPFTARATPAT